jgi:hypothetical protein
MKLQTSLVALILMSITLIARGQSVPEPEFKNSIGLVNGNALQALERISPTYVSKMKGLGYGGADLLFTADGAASNVRINSSGPQFVFKASDEDTDPSLIVKLLRVDVKKNKRLAKQGNVSMIGTTAAAENLVPVTFKKIKPGIYMITLQNAPLEKGEYALQVPLNYNAQAATLGNSNCLWFAFGVD